VLEAGCCLLCAEEQLLSVTDVQAANIAEALLRPRDPNAPPQPDPAFQDEADYDGSQAAARVVELPGPAVTPVKVVPAST
jgi:hypothetical protein